MITMFNKIIDCFLDKISSPAKLIKSIKTCKDEDLLKNINEYLKKHPEYENKPSLLIKAVCLNKFPKRCKNCGKMMTYSKSINHDYCCVKCAQLSEDVKNKIKNTCIKHFGVEHHLQNKDIIEKRKLNSIEKYGVDSPRKLKEISDKIKKTCIEKYGGNSPASSEEIKTKIKNTCIKKYNVEYSGQAEIKKEKTKLACLKKFGVSSIFKSKEIQNKIKNTIVKKYGVDNPMKSQAIKDRIKINNFKKLIDRCILNGYEPMFSLDEYKTWYNNDVEFKWRCTKCGNVFTSNIIQQTINGVSTYIPRCLSCYPVKPHSSFYEIELANFCRKYFKDVQTNVKNIIGPYELDIYIPEKNLAIEFNGDYWHSVNAGKDINYHIMKTDLCASKGIRLIHIFEHQWIHKNNIVKNKLLSIFNVEQKRLFARKCSVKEISSDDKNIFLNENHIQGTDKSSIKLGLFSNENKLVAVMTFGKPRFNKKYEYELIRYATSCHVLGGAGKLLRYFEKNYHPKSIITYADKCYSFGNMYRKIGFKEIKPSKPNYFYIKDNLVLSRYECQKSKLKKLLGEQNFDNSLSEQENMFKNNFFKVYDCGNLVFEKLSSF